MVLVLLLVLRGVAAWRWWTLFLVLLGVVVLLALTGAVAWWWMRKRSSAGAAASSSDPARRADGESSPATGEGGDTVRELRAQWGQALARLRGSKLEGHGAGA